jgi:outer membrane protein assembly factor BamB
MPTASFICETAASSDRLKSKKSQPEARPRIDRVAREHTGGQEERTMMTDGVHPWIRAALCLAGMLVGGLAAAVPAIAAKEPAGDESALAAHLTKLAGTSRGVCSVLGCEDGKVALALARQTEFLVHVWEPRASAVAAARELAGGEGLLGERIIVEKGAFQQLPYADSTVDLVIAACLTDRDLDALASSEVVRVLRPGGKALLGRGPSSAGAGTALTRLRLEQWLRTAQGSESDVREDDAGLWGRLARAPLTGTDAWSHWEHGPDNNPVSTDAVIKAPYMTQWLGQPYYIAMPAITTAAAGRIFLAMGHIAHHQREEAWLNTLMAANGYNGTTLWTRKLPDGYLAHRSAFIATPETFYMIDEDGTGCLLLNPETGERKGRISVSEPRGYWKWIAMQDGVLFALIGKESDRPETTIVRSQYTHWSWGELSKGYYEPRVPWGFGNAILAYDPAGRKVLWTHKEDKPIDSRAMAMGGGQLFFYGPDLCIGCLNARTGELVWKNEDPKVRGLIEEPGRGLGSTPGFRTACYALYTPKALFYEAQTQMNVVAISPRDGSLLWHRTKTTSNPNMLYLDDRLLVGIGPDGSTLALDPMTGKTIEDLGLKKRSCARLTATPDSLFCRGWPEGLARYDRINREILFNGAFRPSCNDGVIAANGLLYAGPWACDCNLSLMGRVAMCSAGKFEFERRATDADRLEAGEGDISRVVPLEVSENDWATYRGNSARSSGTPVTVSRTVFKVWDYQPRSIVQPTAPTAAGGLIFLGGGDGRIRAITAAAGTLKWSFATAGPIMQPPTIWNGRAYVGSGDGYIYSLEAATGRLLWRFRAAPVERRIMIYGSLCSTWPVNTGVLIKDGVAYAAAGIIDYDGTYVYALDALTGRIKWQNVTSGHLDKHLRKGVSAQGVLTIADGRLWMPGGNVISPAAYDLNTGEYAGGGPGDGSPRVNRGEEIGVLAEHCLVLGGRLRYSSRENIVDPGDFCALTIKPGKGTGPPATLNTGKVPPAWNGNKVVFVDGRHTVPFCCTIESRKTPPSQGDPRWEPQALWRADWLRESDTNSVAVAGNAVLVVCEVPQPRQLASRWRLRCLNVEDGRRVWERDLPSAAAMGGLLVDRDGRVIVVMENGSMVCFGDERAIEECTTAATGRSPDADAARRNAVKLLLASLESEYDGHARQLLAGRLETLGFSIPAEARRQGFITDWHLLGPASLSTQADPLDQVLTREPGVDVKAVYTAAGKEFRWQRWGLDDLTGKADLQRVFGDLENVAVYAYAEVRLAQERDLLLKIGSNDGFVCWVNGQEVGRFDGGRRYIPDNDPLPVHGKKGVNAILLKVTQMGAAWQFSARLTDTADTPIDLNNR